ncbi:hypothetical protein [Methylobacterium trifolii]|uniref:Uncharacterized protein n=1 Tax=Methylobacterium trifolii TaxID=1003092 RepID=A0ABQ4TZT6_9HYPH|nr:hypothetical protein [Methylobacterium trifolii]GJE60551.1 hypothetical protein MPOCJGCO_2664 [Methylobacterium trifolii]
MRLKRFTLAAITALTLGTTLGALEASAQYYRDDFGGPRRFERGYDEDRYDRPRRRDYDEDRYDRPRRGRGGSICVTARGNCVTRPAPFNSSCGCEVPGFGFKRGQIGG